MPHILFQKNAFPTSKPIGRSAGWYARMIDFNSFTQTRKWRLVWPIFSIYFIIRRYLKLPKWKKKQLWRWIKKYTNHNLGRSRNGIRQDSIGDEKETSSCGGLPFLWYVLLEICTSIYMCISTKKQYHLLPVHTLKMNGILSLIHFKLYYSRI